MSPTAVALRPAYRARSPAQRAGIEHDVAVDLLRASTAFVARLSAAAMPSGAATRTSTRLAESAVGVVGVVAA